MKCWHLFVLGLLSLFIYPTVFQGQGLNQWCGNEGNASKNSGKKVTVDPDGRIWGVLLDGTWRRIGLSGQTESPTPEEALLLSKGEIVVSRRQLTCPANKWKLVALSSLEPSPGDDSPSSRSVLTVLLFRGAKGTVVVKKRYDEIIKLELDDINGDGKPELALQWTENALIGPATRVDLWSIDLNGEIKPIELKNVIAGLNASGARHSSQMEWGTYSLGDFLLGTTQTVVLTDGSEKRIIKYYRWDKSQGQYQLDDTVIINERTQSKESNNSLSRKKE
jgi:hypothetical protein